MYLCHALTWHRYIDDIFLIWDCTAQQLKELLTRLNNNSFNLTFTMEYSTTHISFFDVDVRVDSSGYIKTSLFRKPTSGNTILRANSRNPGPLLWSIPFGQYLRIRRICFTDSDFEIQASLLKQRLLDRGYSCSLLKKVYKNAWALDKNNLQQKTRKKW